MTNVNEHKCPHCGAPMRFDPEQGLLVCDYCSHTISIEEDRNTTFNPDGFNYHQLQCGVTMPNAEQLPIYSCASCGAEVIASPEQMATTCPYCGNNIVLTDKMSGNLRPNAVIPFKFTSKELPAAVRRFYRNKPLLPKTFFSDSEIGEVTGIYVPFWVFNGRLFGLIDFRGERSSSHRRGDYIVTTTKYYRLSRDCSVSFQDLPADVSGRIDDALMDSLEPFNMSEAVPFDTRYLAGFTADRFDQPKENIEERIRKRMSNTADSVFASRAGRGYSNIQRMNSILNNELSVQYMLFPVYMFDVNYNGQKYHFSVNGQTGKVVGELPISKITSMRYFLTRTGIAAAASMLLVVLFYFFGG